jgi:hypothetical protein
MAEITTLREAVSELSYYGDSVALEGFTHLIPSAAAHEIIRHGLTLIRLTPDLPYDQRGSQWGPDAERTGLFAHRRLRCIGAQQSARHC